jgi:endonuclease-3
MSKRPRAARTRTPTSTPAESTARRGHATPPQRDWPLAKRRAFFERLRRANPNPTTELRYRTPFELLVAVVLSAQATDKGVNRATEVLFAVANTPEAILRLGLRGLKRYIRTIGLFNTKAANILKTCRILVDEYGGEVPRTREALEALPGVGRKTANVILNTAFGESTIAVDTHIFRVANRTGLARGKTVRAVEDKLLEVVPPAYRRHAHHWLILHGRYVCTARAPRCPVCPIYDLCEYGDKVTGPMRESV